MIVGVDFHGTITKAPRTFRKLCEALIVSGNVVYIISAVRRSNISRLTQELKRTKLPYTHLEIVVFDNYLEVPHLKLQACKRLGVRMMFEDREETCLLLARHGILTCQVR